MQLLQSTPGELFPKGAQGWPFKAQLGSLGTQKGSLARRGSFLANAVPIPDPSTLRKVTPADSLPIKPRRPLRDIR